MTDSPHALARKAGCARKWEDDGGSDATMMGGASEANSVFGSRTYAVRRRGARCAQWLPCLRLRVETRRASLAPPGTHTCTNGASGYGIGTVAKSNRACLTNGNCSAPYVFAAAPAQIISLDLARVLASSPAAIEYTTKSREILNDPVRSRTFASEDSWLGFALSDLLPANFTGITLADIERFTYTFDDWGARMTPFTMFFHDKQKKAHRIIAAYHYSLAHSCDSNVQITCSKRDEQRRTSESCRLLPGNRSPGSRDRFQNCSRGGPPAGDLRYSPYYSCLTNSPAQQQRLISLGARVNRGGWQWNWTASTCAWQRLDIHQNVSFQQINEALAS